MNADDMSVTDQPDDPSRVPTEHQHPRPRTKAESLVLVNTGHGKGKSTAAFGVLWRGLALEWRCGVVQFIKSGKWRTGEEAMGRKMGVDWWALGDGFTWLSDDLDESQARGLAAWEAAETKLAAGELDLLVLDEITYPINWGWIEVDRVVAALRDRAATTNVICTGRDAPAALLDVADTVTEMHSVKHAYQRGIRAMRGIDF